jgi:hypothetical protein
MTSRWNERLARVGAAVDAAFGEPVRIMPMAGGDYAAPGPDPNRAAFDLAAAEFIAPRIQIYGGDGHNLSGQRFETVVAPEDAELHIREDRLVGKPQILKDDRVLLTDSGRRYRVNHVDKHRPGFVVLKMAIDRQSQ